VLRKFLETNGARIGVPDDRTFETEGEAIESGLRRTVEGRDTVMRSLIRGVYRFRDATLVAEKKDDFGNALQNLYRELERAEDLVGICQVNSTEACASLQAPVKAMSEVVALKPFHFRP
jgi:hypothetical protein